MIRRIMCMLLILATLMGTAAAGGIQEEVWVLCSPGGLVNIRSKPGGAVFGAAACGTVMWTDNRQRNGFLHVMELAAEEEEGWISSRYIVYDEPEEVNAEMRITASGRVACRKWIGGKVIRWAMPGDLVTVYWISDEWAVTGLGYIRSEFLEAVE